VEQEGERLEIADETEGNVDNLDGERRGVDDKRGWEDGGGERSEIVEETEGNMEDHGDEEGKIIRSVGRPVPVQRDITVIADEGEPAVIVGEAEGNIERHGDVKGIEIEDISGVASVKGNKEGLGDGGGERAGMGIVEETEGKKDVEGTGIEGDRELAAKEEKKKKKEKHKKEKKEREKDKEVRTTEEVLKQDGEIQEEMEGIFERKKKDKKGEGRSQEKNKKHKRVESLHDEDAEAELVEDVGEKKRKEESKKKKKKDEKLNSLETSVPQQISRDNSISFVNVKDFKSTGLSDDD
jgi:hypothetical protein